MLSNIQLWNIWRHWLHQDTLVHLLFFTVFCLWTQALKLWYSRCHKDKNFLHFKLTFVGFLFAYKRQRWKYNEILYFFFRKNLLGLVTFIFVSKKRKTVMLVFCLFCWHLYVVSFLIGPYYYTTTNIKRNFFNGYGNL